MNSTAVQSRGVVAATPYAWPYHGRLDPAHTALVACCDLSWRPARPDADRADAALGALARALGDAGGLVVVLSATPARRHPGRPQAPAVRLDRGASPAPAQVLVPGAPSPTPTPTPAPAAVPVLNPSLTLTASGVGGFYGSGLDDRLRSAGIRDLMVAGWGLEGPVHSTLRAANDRGYECLLVGDASVAVDPALTFAALDMVRHSGGIFGAYARTESVLTTLDHVFAPGPAGAHSLSHDLEAP